MTRRTTLVVFCGAWLLASPLTALSQEAGDRPPEIGSVARTARATIERLRKQPASWSATTGLTSGVRIRVEVLASPEMRRTVLSIEAQGKRAEMSRIVERDGSWYVTEGRKAGRYRPYEAPFELPTAYFYFARSEPKFVREGFDLGTFERTRDGIATYRTPLPASLRQELKDTLDEREWRLRQQPGRAADSEGKRTAEGIRDLLQKGTPTEVEIATGRVIRYGAADRHTEFHDFRWLNRVPPGAFDVGATKWEDFTGDPTAGGTDDLLMIAFAGQGMKFGDTDGRLLDLRTGRVRRIPFRGTISVPGCFLKGRVAVAVRGADPSSGAMGLYEVNLRTGENRRLGGALLSSGMTSMPALSPDGKTLAVLHRAMGRPLDQQVCLVDLETGEARTVGKPHNMAFLSWLPDGRGLVLLYLEDGDPSDLNRRYTETIARMDLGGRLTKIRDGGMPVLLNDGKTILFSDPKSRTWQTCGLDGGDLKPYANGLAGYGFPSPAPDGRRIIMMHYRAGSSPEPTILPIGGSDSEPAITAPGRWELPAWR